MTTLRDLLFDFAEEVRNIPAEVKDRTSEVLDDDLPEKEQEAYDDVLNELLDEYVGVICKRWVGQI